MHTLQSLLLSAAMLLVVQLQAQDEVTFALFDTTVTPSVPICETFKVRNFEEITNFQFTLRWDPTVIRLDSITGFSLPFPDFFNTNLSLAPNGLIPIIWIDPTGAGVTVDDGTTIFEVCYTAIGIPISSTLVEISSDPLSKEIASVSSAGEDIGLLSEGGIVNIVLPYNLPQTVQTNVNCYNPQGGEINITPTGGQAPYTYAWTGPSGFSSTSQDIIGVGDGIYQLILSDNSQPPLVDTFDFEILGDFDPPVADAGTASEVVDCIELTTQLNGIGSSMGNNIRYEWSTDDGTILSNGTTLAPLVEGGGTYTLLVTNLVNGCTAESDVVVQADTIAPDAVVVPDQRLNCLLSTITLDGSASSTGSEFNYQWQTQDGNIVSGANTLMPVVDQGGTYQLLITNNDNGCTAEVDVPVAVDTISPLADIGNALVIDCANPILTIGGMNTSTGADFRYEWQTQDGNILSGDTEAMASVDRPGTYNFTVINQANGCSTTVDAVVTLDDEVPTSDAGLDTSLTCFAPIIFLGGSNTATGSDIVYEWTTADGRILSDSSRVRIQVDLSGTYELRVRDTMNSCESVSSVEVANNFPPAADGGPDQAVCSAEALLEASLPTDITGAWRSLSGAIVENPDETSSLVMGLEGGQNFFVWSTSTDRCPNYSQDTVLVNLETDPTANDDFYDIPFGQGFVQFDLAANDGILTQTDWNIRLLGDVPAGSLVDGATKGTFDWTYPANFSSIGQIDYELCNAICPDFCDTATIFFEIRENLDTTVMVSNAFTPNDDGTNDTFIIDELRNNPDLYPNTEMMVFNRWGNIVYHVIPYMNDWNGKNDSGEDLPEGTYYYILKLNLPDGKVLKGDVTILR
ncbi:MAG: gliding motility-associated C-terminal domain-containing protein [Bacteroidota bacterium]